MARNQPGIYTVRNDAGQFIGTYRANSAAAAIQRVVDDQLSMAATFRKSHRPVTDTRGWTAAIESPPAPWTPRKKEA